MIQKYKYFFFVLLLLELLFFSFVTYDKKNKIQNFLDLQTVSSERKYATIYNSFQQAALIMNDSISRRSEIIGLFKDAYTADERERSEIRSEMLYLLEDDFILLQKLNFKAIHFFLPNNQCFLNLDEPGVFGLSQNDSKVMSVQKHHQKTEGFEIGTLNDLFSFVYPLYDEDRNYIGALKISLTADAFLKKLEETFDAHMHLIVDKEALRSMRSSALLYSYITSSENDFYLSSINDNEPQTEVKMHKNFFNHKFKEEFLEHLKSSRSFSLYNDTNAHGITVTFLTLEKNKNTRSIAYYVLYKEDFRMGVLQKNYLMVSIIGSLALFLVLLFIVTQIDQKKALKESYRKQKNETEKAVNAKRELEITYKAMRDAKADAERASHAKSGFLANMSHEIRTPLNAINGFISLLKKEETDVEKLEYFEIINQSSVTLLQIINDMLDFSKIESGKLHIETVDFFPKKELYGTAKLFQAKAAEKEIVLDINCNDDMPEILHGDALRLKQILTNLLSNAIKFTPARGEIFCKITYKDGHIFFRVEDNGIGITEDKQQTIFEPFSQADSSTVREYGGTGLGLSISAKLVEMLGGRLKVKSKVGQGSHFFFSIPITVGVIEKNEDTLISLDDEILKGHVLVVEDNEANQMYVGITLRNSGLTYDIAENGIVAVEKFKNQQYDIILMDENMPKLNGIGATKEILKIEKKHGLEHTPIIALTANALVGDRQIFLDAGMDEYLTKPIEPSVLILSIKKMMYA